LPALDVPDRIEEADTAVQDAFVAAHARVDRALDLFGPQVEALLGRQFRTLV